MAFNQGNKYINVTMVRHSQSLANVYKEQNKVVASSLDYKNSKLSDLGKYQIEMARNEIIHHIGNYDLILTSPLKRAIQTCQLVLQDDNINKRYPCAIMAELNNIVENKFDGRTITQSDPDIMSLPNYDKIVWNDHTKYDSLWKHEYTGKYWGTDEFYSYRQKRIFLLKQFLANLYSGDTSNNILIFTHQVLISEHIYVLII